MLLPKPGSDLSQGPRQFRGRKAVVDPSIDREREMRVSP